MKIAEQMIRDYIPKVNIMQLATSVNDQPWLCTVHFFSDEELNFYWCSTIDRRHSKEIAGNSRVACYVLVHENTPHENYVIGISVEGTAVLVDPQHAKAAIEGYVSKLGKDKATLRDLMNGTKPLYRLTPTSIVMFNNKDFPENSRQEWRLT